MSAEEGTRRRLRFVQLAPRCAVSVESSYTVNFDQDGRRLLARGVFGLHYILSRVIASDFFNH